MNYRMIEGLVKAGYYCYVAIFPRSTYASGMSGVYLYAKIKLKEDELTYNAAIRAIKSVLVFFIL